AYVDHVFESLWPKQSRGVPWFSAGMRDLHDVVELREALRIKKRVEACLAIIETPAVDDTESGRPPGIGEQKKAPSGRTLETLRPGMIHRTSPGSTITTVNPSSSGEGDAFLRQEMMGVSAGWGVPFHIVTGNVNDVNYTSLRADKVMYDLRLDDWIANTVDPFGCTPAFRRRMQVEALRRNEPRLTQVRSEWIPAPRIVTDPLKDIAAEIMEVRAFPGMLGRSLASRGLDLRRSTAEQKATNALLDDAGVVLDTDPRKINGAGTVQAPVGFVLPKAKPGDGEDRSRALDFMGRMTQALLARDQAAIRSGYAEASTATRAGDPMGAVYGAILDILTED
ncbi:MAG TPA: phage portal protein, partial [Phenylobacterium sp.]|nr:phage portal protein [Phenylobacterium sp.]